jgi:hypothetical protein
MRNLVLSKSATELNTRERDGVLRSEKQTDTKISRTSGAYDGIET